MSNEGGGAARSDDGLGDRTRVGTAERDEAVGLLAEHWQAGRLDPAEHELRVTRARAAVTQADLEVLFCDLPRPVPQPQPTAWVAHGDTGVAHGDTGGRSDGGRDTIMALAPFAALVLFFVTHTWLWFLMVPVLGIVLYGPGGRRYPGQRRR